VIRTPFTELLGIEHPVVCAGLGGGGGNGELAGRGEAVGHETRGRGRRIVDEVEEVLRID
jgi:hypothetical protein